MNQHDLGLRIGRRIIDLSKRRKRWFRKSHDPRYPMSEVLALRLHFTFIAIHSRINQNSDAALKPLCDQVVSYGVALLDRNDVLHIRATLRDRGGVYNERDQRANLEFCLVERHTAYLEVESSFSGGPESQRLIEAHSAGAQLAPGNAMLTICNLFAFYCDWKGLFTADGAGLNPRVAPNSAAAFSATRIIAGIADEVNALLPKR